MWDHCITMIYSLCGLLYMGSIFNLCGPLYIGVLIELIFLVLNGDLSLHLEGLDSFAFLEYPMSWMR